MSNLNEIKKLNPFGKFCCSVGHIPTSYMEALSYEEQLLWFCDFLKNEVIPTVNNNANAVEELQNLYIELKNYVNNYFNNLDVQEEINKKLDTMAEDGTLTNLIRNYIDPIITEFENTINTQVINQNTEINKINNKVNSLASGSPLVASSISEMTDTTRIYVNTTDGNWYYYDGTSWVVGGVYQSAEDSTTLTNLLKSNNVLDSYLYFYGNQKPVITQNGNTFTFEIPVNLRILNLDQNGNLNFLNNVTLAEAQTISIDNATAYLVYDIEDNLFKAVNGTGLRTATNQLILVALCNNGHLYGEWTRYLNEQIRNKHNLSNNILSGYVYFYHNEKPTFIISNNEITVTIPTNLRLAYIDKNEDIFLNVATLSEEQTLTLNNTNGNYLVYNATTNAFQTLNATEIRTSTDILILVAINNNGVLNGQWLRYYLEDKIEKISEGNETLPDYYNSYLANKIQEIISMIGQNGIDEIDFICISDIHYNNNTGNSANLIKNIIQNTQCKNVFCLGDLINQVAGDTPFPAIEYLEKIIHKYSDWYFDTNWTIGNHEYNNPGNSQEQEYLNKQLSIAQIYNTFPNKNILANNTYAWYKDDNNKKVRYISNVCKVNTVQDENAIPFILEALQNTPSDYDIIVLTHSGFTPSTWYTSDFTPIVNALTSYKNKTSFTYNDITYDFTNKQGNIIGVFGGHYHKDGYFTDSSGIPFISITTDNANQAQDEYDRTIGTVSEQAFDVISINRTNRTIYLKRIGGGSDRQYTY